MQISEQELYNKYVQFALVHLDIHRQLMHHKTCRYDTRGKFRPAQSHQPLHAAIVGVENTIMKVGVGEVGDHGMSGENLLRQTSSAISGAVKQPVGECDPESPLPCQCLRRNFTEPPETLPISFGQDGHGEAGV